MSFILDALKKSENERQRQIGPSLADAPMRKQRVERPWWAIAVAALLIVNLGVLVVVLARDGGDNAPATAGAATPRQQDAPLAVSASSPTRAGTGPVAAPAQYAPPPQARMQPDMQAAAPVLPPTASPAVRSLADEAGVVAPLADEVGALDPSLAAAARVPEGPPLVRPIEAPNVAPLPNAATFAARTNPGAGSTGSNDNNEVLPTHSALVSSGTNLPDLRLDIHVYSASTAERFVFVNMHRYSEGQTMSEGPAVERITADGVVLNQNGLRFLLPRQ